MGGVIFLRASSAEESSVARVHIFSSNAKRAARVRHDVVQRTSTISVGKFVVNVETSKRNAVCSHFHRADTGNDNDIGFCQNQVSTIAIRVRCHPQEVGLTFLKTDRNFHRVFEIVLLHLAARNKSLGSQTDIICSVVLNTRLGQSIVNFASRNVSSKLVRVSEPLRAGFPRFNTDSNFSSLHAKTDTRSSCKLKTLAISVKVKSHPNFVFHVWLQVASDVHLVRVVIHLKFVSTAAVASSSFDRGRRHIHAAFSHQPVKSSVRNVVVNLVSEGKSLLGDGILVHRH